MATRRKKKAAADDGAFEVGTPQEAQPAAEEPSLSEETVDGLIGLRAHITDNVPQLLWPLRELPSLQQHLSNIESAGEAVEKLSVRHALSNGKLAELRRFLLEDNYAFTFYICRHTRIVPEVHMAMCYASAGQAQRLAWLSTRTGFERYVIDRFREACAARSIDPRMQEGVLQLDRALDWQNQRWPRGWFKSSGITHSGTVAAGTLDPDRSIIIVCAKEDKATEIVEQAGKTVQSGIFHDLFPERVPTERVLKSEFNFGGRSVSSREKTVQGASYISREIGGHYSDIRTDDIVIRDARGGIIGGGEGGPAIRWLHGMRGMRIIKQRWRRVHVGTINADDDDHAWLTYGRRSSLVVSIVVPSETFNDGKFPDSVYTRGTPTAPTFFDETAITEALDDTLADESEADGVEAFRSDFWLAPTPGTTKPLKPAIVNDPMRAWLGPFLHPKSRERHARINYAARFMIGRYERNADCTVRDDAKVATYDPYDDTDTVLTLAASWRQGGRKWAITASAIDSDLVKFALETRSGDGGMSEWIAALVFMADLYSPRAIGIDSTTWADGIVANAFATDRRLLPLSRRVKPVNQTDTAQEARVRVGVVEPLTQYRLLLMPETEDGSDYGAKVVRREMLRYRADSDQAWPVLDSLAMVDAVMIRPPSRAERERIRRSALVA